MENLGYLFAAYSIIFAVIFAYVIFLGRRQTRLDGQLRALENKLNDVRGDLAARTSAPVRPDAPARPEA
jgi:CcmD family protein